MVCVISRSEYVSPGLMKISRRSSDSGTTMLPASFTSRDLEDVAFVHVDRDEDVVLLRARSPPAWRSTREVRRSRDPCSTSAAFRGRPTAIRARSGRPACTRTASSACSARTASSSSSSVNAVLPAMLICRMRARLPSLTSIVTLTLLPGTSSTLASTRTAYLPREKY